MPDCCEVALPVPLDRLFTYAVGEGQDPQRGVRVIVPFRNEKLIGVVVKLDVAAPADVELRQIETVLDDEPLLSEQLLSLAEWMAGYYLAPLGEVLRGMLPLMAEVRRTGLLPHYRSRAGRAGGEALRTNALIISASTIVFCRAYLRASRSRFRLCGRRRQRRCLNLVPWSAGSGLRARPRRRNAMRAEPNALLF